MIAFLIKIYLIVGLVLGLYAIRPGFTKRTRKYLGTAEEYKASRWYWFLSMLFGWGYFAFKKK